MPSCAILVPILGTILHQFCTIEREETVGGSEPPVEVPPCGGLSGLAGVLSGRRALAGIPAAASIPPNAQPSRQRFWAIRYSGNGVTVPLSELTSQARDRLKGLIRSQRGQESGR